MMLSLGLVLIQLFSIVFTQSVDNLNENAYQEVDCPGIGHFTTEDFFDPKYRPFVFLPKCADKINVKFLLHTRKNPKEPQVITQGDTQAIKDSNFNSKNPTKMITHGFLDNQLFGDWMRTMRDEFLKAGDYNVIIIDWSGGNGLPYGQATANTRVVGPVVGMFIKDLETVSGLQLSDVHILGHSLGSHVAGYAGEFLKGQVGRITGLDPAGPYYEGLPAAAKLDATDAQFVDAIHTDAVHLIPDLGFGTYETSGHLDFYPNGGYDQPGCDSQRWLSIITQGLLEGVRRLVSCCHQRAVDFYIESINGAVSGVGYQCQDFDSFTGGVCNSCGDNGDKCAVVGEKAVQTKKYMKTTRDTRFFLSTADKSQFFRYEYEVQVKMQDDTGAGSDNHGTVMLTLHGDNDETINLVEKDQIFHLGQTYTYIAKYDFNFGDIKKLTFKWHRTLGSIIKQKMYIDSIKVIPLSSDNIQDKQKHMKEIKTFCTTNPEEGVKNEEDVDFSVICN